jgi:hypothetical protein|nr:MAG TPA: hypothetical protein [Caudoviricetes sp.]
MNIKRVEKYAESLKGIDYLEWLELQKIINAAFKEKLEKLQIELDLKLVEKEGGGYGLPEENNENVRT